MPDADSHVRSLLAESSNRVVQVDEPLLEEVFQIWALSAGSQAYPR